MSEATLAVSSNDRRNASVPLRSDANESEQKRRLDFSASNLLFQQSIKTYLEQLHSSLSSKILQISPAQRRALQYKTDLWTQSSAALDISSAFRDLWKNAVDLDERRAPEAIDAVDLRLERLKKLNDGWLDEDSVAPTSTTLADAQKLLTILRAEGAPRPIISASDDGVIHFDWRNGEKKASVRIEGDGEFGFALFRNGRYQPGQEDGKLEDDILPRELRDYLVPIEENA